jgi:hypothetical protein
MEIRKGFSFINVDTVVGVMATRVTGSSEMLLPNMPVYMISQGHLVGMVRSLT